MIRLDLGPMLERRGRSFYWLTKNARINPSVMTRMKHHTIKAITLDVLDRICAVLECEPGDVLIRLEEKPVGRPAKAASKKKATKK